MDKVKIERLDSNQEIPYDLLLLADETVCLETNSKGLYAVGSMVVDPP